jgi:hypothetical protein
MVVRLPDERCADGGVVARDRDADLAVYDFPKGA